MSPGKAIIVGISGASSSGKTTLARLLRDIFPNTFVIHEDDFYKEEKDLPIKHGLLDWDSSDSLDLSSLQQQLSHTRTAGTLSSDFHSKEDLNEIGPNPLNPQTLVRLQQKVALWTEKHFILSNIRLCVLDGFLLYTPKLAKIQELIDIKFFLQVSFNKAKARREARSGYATIEGFWEDPPGYVDTIVWPNYVEDHAWLFEDNDVEGVMTRKALVEDGIEWFGAEDGKSAVDVDIDSMLEWIVARLCIRLEELEISAGETSTGSVD